MVVSGTWLVRYEDGQEIHQYDATHPAFNNGEVPFRAIDWTRARAVRFDSQWASAEFKVQHPGAGWTVALRARYFAIPGGNSIGVYVLVTYPEHLEPQDAVDALYWIPDGSVHYCHQFACAEVVNYVQGILKQDPRALPLEHNALDVTLSAEIS